MPMHQYLLILSALFAYAVAHGGHFIGHMKKPSKQFPNSRDHPCRRECVRGARPRVCDYEFDIAWYITMGTACHQCPNRFEDCFAKNCVMGSGSRRGIMAINEQMPGPSIEVCLGDTIRVNVMNNMLNGESIAIHWHGMLQKGTQFMDGAAMFSQCPIIPMNSMIYEFNASVPGTYFYHSHSGFQRGDGMGGSLIVRQHDDPQRHLYDTDGLDPIMIQDWYSNMLSVDRFTALSFAGDFRTPVQNLLLNGVQPSLDATENVDATSLPPFPVSLPSVKIKLNSRKRYRFRIINNSFMLSPVQITITGHHMVVLASDGHPIQPICTRALTINPAERYDIRPYFTGEEVASDGVYYFNVDGLAEAEGVKTFFKFSYKKNRKPKVESCRKATRGASKHVLSDVNYWDWTPAISTDDNGITLKRVSEFRSLDDNYSDDDISREPDFRHAVVVDFHRIKVPNESGKFLAADAVAVPRINDITNMMPHAPLLRYFDDLPPEMFCNAKYRSCPKDQFCECIHAVPVPLGALVELVVIDSGILVPNPTFNHIFHLHGYAFQVLAAEIVHLNFTVADFKEMDRQGKIKRNFKRPPVKDTIGIAPGGYTIIRFVADNPGPWLFHCHLDFHMELGMAMIFRVGDQDDLPPMPEELFRCGNLKGHGHH